LNSDEALQVVDTLVAQEKVVRVSGERRITKGIVFRTVTGRHFAVALNSGAAQDPAKNTKVVFEKAPAGQTLAWSIVGKMPEVRLSDAQAYSSLYRLNGANLEPGKQMVAMVASEAGLQQLIDWYADAVPLSTMPALERGAVESAMAKYDELGMEGFAAAHPELNGPVDYWVRPSRQRAHDRYPSRAIAALALGAPSLDGGWATPASAASLLSNLGYIVVDEAGSPIPVPADQYGHLIIQADRIRACALTNYIAPARERGDASVTIVAGRLNNEMGLSQGWSSVCNAVGGRLFMEYASVPAPDKQNSDNSTTTTYTYHLRNTTTTMSHPNPATTNLILYGPPGTGKTYESAAAAVRLCLGDEEAAPLLAEDRSSELMQTYHKLAEAGRIEFITFHQSYSYEDFVEGLRPTTDAGEAAADDGDLMDGDDDGANAALATGGFRLCSRDGVFKRICERARLDLGGARDGKRLDRSRSIFKIALGRRGVEEERVTAGLSGNLIHLGWGGDIDWSNERFKDFDEVRRAWHDKKDPRASGKDPNIEMTHASGPS
jgi:5-methylcytosine-specific restriction protein B